MGRRRLWLVLGAVAALAPLGARAQTPPAPPAPAPAPAPAPRSDLPGPKLEFSSIQQINERVAKLRDTLEMYGEGMHQTARRPDSCPEDYEEQVSVLRWVLTIEQRRLREAALSGPDVEGLKTRIELAIGQIELIKQDLPKRYDCGQETRQEARSLGRTPKVETTAQPPPEEPKESIMDEIDYADPVLGIPPKSQPKPPPPPAPQPPPGVQRPPLTPTSALVVPKAFCSEFERNAYLEKVYNPAVAAANANAQAATAYQAQVTEAANARMRAGDGAAWGPLLAEVKAYEPVMQQALATSRELGPMYSQILAVPVSGDCPQIAQAEPPPALAVPSPATGVVKSANPEDCPPKPGRKPIVVGPNGRVGSGARLKSKVASTALGVAGNLLGAPKLPIGGGGGGGPPMVDCRIKDSEMTVFQDAASGVALKVGAKQAGDTLVVFAKVDRSSDNGTFQTAFLQRPDGSALAPADVGICDLWGEWKLTVSWTKETYVNNELVDRQTGGWSEGGRFSIPGVVSTAERPDGLWRRLGFSNASHGARMVALQFRVPAGQAADPKDLVVHVTRPGGDPVTTVPFAIAMAPKAGGGFQLAKAPEDCPPGERPQVAEGPAEPGGVTQVSNPTADPPGPTPASNPGPQQPAAPSVCGPDVTAAFVHELALAWMRLNRLSGDEKGVFDGALFLKRNGINIDALPSSVEGQCPLGPCAGDNPRGQPCYRLWGVCVPRHAFNDIMFGLVARGVDVPYTIQVVGGQVQDRITYGGDDPPTSRVAYAVGNAIGERFAGGQTTITPEMMAGDPYWIALRLVIAAEYPFSLDCQACPDPAPGRIIKSFARVAWELEDGTYDRYGAGGPSPASSR